MMGNHKNLRIGVAAAAAACFLAAFGNNGTLSAPSTVSNAGGPQGVDSQAQVEPNNTKSPTPRPSPPNIWTGPGHVVGLDNQFNPVDGNTDAFNGGPIDGSPCRPTMSNNYHVHVFVGIYVNGTAYAVPDAIGMFKPAAEQNGFTATAQCYYDVHTHDASGIVHVEAKDPQNVPITGTIYNSSQLFDEWGINVAANHFGPFNGTLKVITSGQTYRGGPGNGVIYRSTYGAWTGDPNKIPLYSHEVLFFEIGPNYPKVLPNIIFYAEF